MALGLGCQVRGEGPACPTCCHVATLAGNSHPGLWPQGQACAGLSQAGLPSGGRDRADSRALGVGCPFHLPWVPGAGLCLPVLCRKRVLRGDRVLGGGWGCQEWVRSVGCSVLGTWQGHFLVPAGISVPAELGL